MQNLANILCCTFQRNHTFKAQLKAMLQQWSSSINDMYYVWKKNIKETCQGHMLSKKHLPLNLYCILNLYSNIFYTDGIFLSKLIILLCIKFSVTKNKKKLLVVRHYFLVWGVIWSFKTLHLFLVVGHIGVPRINHLATYKLKQKNSACLLA